MGSGLKSKKKTNWMPVYHASNEERKARDFCIKNNIRISPIGIKNEKEKWRIGINLASYKKGEKMNISPNIYDKDTIWPEYFKMCKYYYDKYRK